MLDQPFVQNTEGWASGVKHGAPLTCAEIGRLWQSLSYYTMLKCFYLHFINHLQDSYLRQIFEEGFSMIDTRIIQASDMLGGAGMPLPKGFGDEDVDMAAPRLFTDLFYYYYTFNMSRLDVSLGGLNLANATRSDVREFYTKSLEATMRYFNSFSELMLQKGLYVRPPYISTTKEEDFVDRQTFLRGFLGGRRPLLAGEIDQLFQSYRNNLIAAALLAGFKQVARSEQVRAYMARGVQIAEKHIEIFTRIMEREHLPVPSHADDFITDSTSSPYSERLMMSHVITLSQVGVGNYATAMAACMRHDLSAAFARLIMESANYGEDGLNIMIQNSWFEEPPRHIDRRDLSHEIIH